MKLTQEEKELIIAKRKAEDETKPKKTGILRQSLFILSSPSPEITFNVQHIIDKEKGWWISRDSILGIVEQIKDELMSEVVAPAGTKFVCYIVNGEELWYDDHNIDIEEMDSDWAQKHLTDIKPITKS